jgi:cation:H+ antiporter
MYDYLALLIGIASAGAGGELFVRGTVGISAALRISPGLIAATVAAFATSSPELTVAVNSALQGTPRIALGDALGSNVVNVALILAAAVLVAPIAAPRHTIKRDFPVALVVPVLLAALLSDGVLSQLDGALLLGLFAGWLVAVAREAWRQRNAAVEVLGARKPARALIEGAIGLVLLIVAGRLIVAGATGVAEAHGIDAFIIGATVVAVGTSVPELATAIVSGLRGHEEVGLGTILGSNVFNGLFIIGVASSITPIGISLGEIAPALILGVAALALAYPSQSGVIERWRGLILLGVYATYLFAIFQWA